MAYVISQRQEKGCVVLLVPVCIPSINTSIRILFSPHNGEAIGESRCAIQNHVHRMDDSPLLIFWISDLQHPHLLRLCRKKWKPGSVCIIVAGDTSEGIPQTPAVAYNGQKCRNTISVGHPGTRKFISIFMSMRMFTGHARGRTRYYIPKTTNTGCKFLM